MRLRWRDADGMLHAVEGSELVPGDPPTFAQWTRCGAADVLLEESWAGDERVDCLACARIEAGLQPLRCQPTTKRLADFREAMQEISTR